MSATSRLPKDKPKLVSLEKIQNGFLIIFEEEDLETKKYYRGTLNGIVGALEKIWDLKIIKHKEEPQKSKEKELPIAKKYKQN